MFKISITKNNQVTNQAHFQTQAEADAWLAQEEANKSFGKPAGFYPISQLSQEELAQEISRKEVDELGNPLMEVMVEIPAQYLVSTEDITAQVEAEKAKKDKKQKDRGDRVTSLKAIDLTKNLSATQVETIVKLLVIELLKDEE